MDVGTLNAKLTLNTAGFNSGIQQAISSFNTLGMAAIQINQGLQLVRAAVMGLETAFRSVKGAVEDYNMSVIKNAAMMTTLMTKNKNMDLAEKYKLAKQYAIGLQDTMEQIDKNTLLNAYDLSAITEEMIKQGTVLDVNNQKEIQGFTNYANALAAITSGMPNKMIQLHQETRALLTGQARVTDSIAQFIGQQTDNLKEQIMLHKKNGDLWTWIGEQTRGFAAASGDIQATWEAVGSSLETIWRQTLRAGFGAAFKDIIDWGKQFSDWAVSNKAEIGSGLRLAWESLKAVIWSVWQIIVPFEGLFIAIGVITKTILDGWAMISMVALPPIAAYVRGILEMLRQWTTVVFTIGDIFKNVGMIIYYSVTGQFEKAVEHAKQNLQDSDMIVAMFKDMPGIAEKAATEAGKAWDNGWKKYNEIKNPKDSKNVIPALSSLGLGGGKGEKDKDYDRFTKEYNNAIEQVSKKIIQVQGELAGLGTQDTWEAAMIKQKTEAAALNAEYSKLLKTAEKYGEGKELKEKLAQFEKINVQTVNAKLNHEMLKAIQDAEFATALVGLDAEHTTIAKINNQWKDYIAHVQGARENVQQLTDEIIRQQRLAQVEQIRQQANAGERSTAFAGDRINMGGRNRAMQGVWEQAMPQLEAANSIEQFDALYAQYDRLAQAAGRAFDLQQIDAFAQKIQNMVEPINMVAGAFEAMTGVMGDALAEFAQTGKLDFQNLIQSMIKELQIYAAKFTAQLLMQAAFCGIMGLVKSATEDEYGAAQYYAAAIAALEGAAIMGSFVLGSGLANMAHKGITDVPEDGTWLLQKGERVVDSKTNADLKDYMKGGGGTTVNMNVTINDGDEEGVLKALPQLKEMIVSTVTQNISQGGVINRTIKTYT